MITKCASSRCIVIIAACAKGPNNREHRRRVSRVRFVCILVDRRMCQYRNMICIVTIARLKHTHPYLSPSDVIFMRRYREGCVPAVIAALKNLKCVCWTRRWYLNRSCLAWEYCLFKWYVVFCSWFTRMCYIQPKLCATYRRHERN